MIYDANGRTILNGRPSARNAVKTFEQQTLGRLRFARQAGLQYDGDRDLYRVAGYVPEDGLEFSHYWGRYRRHPIAGRIVDMPAMTTWRNPPQVTEPDADPDEPTPFMQAFDELAKRINLWHYLERADRLAGVGRFGVLFIGTTDAQPDNLSMPMGRLGGPDDVLYVHPYHEGHATVEEWETDPTSPRFGMPSLYEIDLSSGVTGFPDAKMRVHWSRAIHIAEDLLSDEVFGRPRLERVFNVLQDAEKVQAGSGESFWQLADRVLQLKMDADAQFGTKDIEQLTDAVEEIYHDLRRFVALQGAELSWLTGDPPDPSGAFDLVMTLFAVGSGIPKRILFGSETGERASTEDQKTWMGQIAERQERFAEPVIVRALVDRLSDQGALPTVKEYDAVWPNLFEAPAKEVAETSKIRAEAAKALAPLGGVPMDLVRIEDGEIVLRNTKEVGDSPFGDMPTVEPGGTLDPGDPSGEDGDERDSAS